MSEAGLFCVYGLLLEYSLDNILSLSKQEEQNCPNMLYYILYFFVYVLICSMFYI